MKPTDPFVFVARHFSPEEVASEPDTFNEWLIRECNTLRTQYGHQIVITQLVMDEIDNPERRGVTYYLREGCWVPDCLRDIAGRRGSDTKWNWSCEEHL